jgi:hypothetical protein
VKLYHTTDSAETILTDGFRDGSGWYGMATHVVTGVFFADQPVAVNEGAVGDQVIEATLPDDVDPDRFELVEEGKPYREWCIPALVNERGSIRMPPDDED